MNCCVVFAAIGIALAFAVWVGVHIGATYQSNCKKKPEDGA